MHGALCGTQGQIAGHLIVSAHMALANTGARTNPIIAGINDFFQIDVGENFFWYIAAGTGYFGINHADNGSVCITAASMRPVTLLRTSVTAYCNA